MGPRERARGKGVWMLRELGEGEVGGGKNRKGMGS